MFGMRSRVQRWWQMPALRIACFAELLHALRLRQLIPCQLLRRLRPSDRCSFRERRNAGRGAHASIPRGPHPARAAIQGERKLVTVMFADLRGSFELIEGTDP